MGKIVLLDEVTANQIAAGEVVERPAAVVKELVENALDAGAARVDVSITGGGMQLIRVADDGCGMAPDDVPVALQRHATSKIRTAADLAAILTLGFRGEALPSIASVSKFRLVTRCADNLAGTEVVVHGGKVVSLGETGCPAGTEIRVENLFYNTPARLKFMKSAGAETARIVDTVQRLALAWPEVAFSLTVNGKVQLASAGNGKLDDAAAQVLGRQNMRQMVPLSWQGPLLGVRGMLSKPSLCRANRNLQYFFVNRRPVRSPMLSDALQTAYHTLLPRNRFPAAVILIELEPSEVDVNVHPAKREVRFSREQDVYRQILAGTKAALREAALIGEVRAPFSIAEQETAANLSIYELKADFVVKSASINTESAYPYQKKQPEFEPGWTVKQAEFVHETAALGVEVSLPATKTAFPQLRPIGQYRSTYILAQAEQGELYIVDQHAAHERILYDMYKRDLSQGQIPVQEVIPQTFELDAISAENLRKNMKIFANLGLSFEEFGNHTFILRSIPLFFHNCLDQNTLSELLVSAGEDTTAASLFEKALQVISCKAAIKANQALDKAEMEALLNNLAAADEPHTCPHGRPTVLVFTERMVARNFRRV